MCPCFPAFVTRSGQVREQVIGIDPQLCGNVLRAQMHNETLLRPSEDPKQASVMFGMRNTEMSERLRRHGNVALRLRRPARRRAHFVSHAYIVPHATDKTRWVALRRTASPRAIAHNQSEGR